MQNPLPQRGPQRLGRYTVFAEIASGGMASVHLGRLLGSAGFSRTVAIKRLHPHLARNPDFVAMFLDEARLAARIRHPNVVHTLDVVSDESELLLVMEYVQGETLARIIRAASVQRMKLPPTIAASIMVGALDGLHAAHEATSERGTPLNIVHRDISPQNIIVGRDGVARVLDFGVAKAAGRVHETKDGSVKGKFAYMAPEQLGRSEVDRRSDVFAASIVLWESLTGERLFDGESLAETVHAVVNREVPPPSQRSPEVPPGLDAVVLKGLEREPDKRYATAHDMAVAIEQVCRPGSVREVGEWVEFFAGPALRTNASLVERIESETSQPSDAPAAIVAQPSDIASEVVANPPRPREQDPSLVSGSHSRSFGSGSFSSSSLTGSVGSKLHSLKPRVQAYFRPFGESIIPWWKALGVLAVVALLGLGAIAALLGFIRYFKGHSPPAPASSINAESTAPPEIAPPPSASTVGVVPVPDPAPSEPVAATSPSGGSPAPSASSPATNTNPPSPTATSTSRRHRSNHGSAAPGISTAAECENPFVIDSSGIKRPKPQCFNK